MVGLGISTPFHLIQFRVQIFRYLFSIAFPQLFYFVISGTDGIVSGAKAHPQARQPVPSDKASVVPRFV